MRKRIGVLVIVLFAVFAMLVACQKEDGPEDVAEQFLTHMAEEKYDEAYDLMDETMQDLLVASDLADAWGALEQAAGEHVSFEFDKKEKEDEFEIVYIESTFSKESITFMVTITADHKVAGFFVI